MCFSTVDENADYDNLDIREHDEEDRYFDEEDPEDIDEDMGCAKFDETDFKMPERNRDSTETSERTVPSQPQDGPS
jgi:hypothetical protein